MREYNPQYHSDLDIAIMIWQPSKQLNPIVIAKYPPESRNGGHRAGWSIAWSPDDSQIISSIMNWDSSCETIYKDNPNFVIWDVHYVDKILSSLSPRRCIKNTQHGSCGAGV